MRFSGSVAPPGSVTSRRCGSHSRSRPRPRCRGPRVPQWRCSTPKHLGRITWEEPSEKWGKRGKKLWFYHILPAEMVILPTEMVIEPAEMVILRKWWLNQQASSKTRRGVLSILQIRQMPRQVAKPRGAVRSVRSVSGLKVVVLRPIVTWEKAGGVQALNRFNPIEIPSNPMICPMKYNIVFISTIVYPLNHEMMRW